ncbi:MAG: 4-(cytidine 5'-diphospho)-2-C-methyl-D-erythritol kinase [Steroidobacteraceae bacterium]
MTAREPLSPQSMRWWPAPAKLNLFLHVTGQRADGFHNLQTVFQLLDWGDEIGIEPTDDARIERIAGPDSIAPEEDLTVRAARALQQVAGVQQGARIRVRKRVPIGGGLGGGSSDAATALRVLARLWNTKLGLGDLAGIGIAIGSDVPVFLGGSSAWAEGRGEELTPIELPEAWYLIVHPGVAVGTAGIFQAPELTRNSPLVTMRGFSPGAGRNDCEPVVRSRYPQVAAALDWLGEGARLSGTGSCVFKAFDRAAAAERVAARVPDEWTSFVARSVNRSPLEAALAIIA